MMTQGTGTGSGSTAAGFGQDSLAYDARHESQTAQSADQTFQAGETAGVKEKAAAAKDEAQQQANDVAGTAKEQASQVAGSVQEQAGNVLAEAKGQAADLLGDLRRQLAEQSDGVRDRLAEFLTSAGSELGDMAGAGGGSGYATQVVRQVGDRAASWGSHLSNHDSADLLEQTRGFARRKPGAFLLGAVMAGVVAGRLTRGAKAHHDEATPTNESTPLQRPTGAVTDTAAVSDVVPAVDHYRTAASGTSGTSGAVTSGVAGSIVVPPLGTPEVDEIVTGTRPQEFRP